MSSEGGGELRKRRGREAKKDKAAPALQVDDAGEADTAATAAAAKASSQARSAPTAARAASPAPPLSGRSGLGGPRGSGAAGGIAATAAAEAAESDDEDGDRDEGGADSEDEEEEEEEEGSIYAELRKPFVPPPHLLEVPRQDDTLLLGAAVAGFVVSMLTGAMLPRLANIPQQSVMVGGMGTLLLYVLWLSFCTCGGSAQSAKLSPVERVTPSMVFTITACIGSMLGGLIGELWLRD